MNNYYVYFHKKKDTNQIFYVGRGKGKRAWSDCRDKFWKACVKKHGLIVEIIHENLTLEESCIFEIKYIKLYGRRGYDENGILLNRSLGGEFGPTGFKYSEESKKKMSNSQKGKKLNQETKNKMSKAKTGNKLSKESCEKISKAKKGHACFNDEWRKKISKTLREGNHSQYYTDEIKEKMSKNMKGRKVLFKQEHIKNLRESHQKRAKTVYQFDLQGNLIKEWISKGEAANYLKKELNLTSNITSQIKDCILGKQKTAFGYIWSYKNETPKNIFELIYQFDLEKNLTNIFHSLKELKIWLKENRIITSKNTIASSIKKNIQTKTYKSGNHFYSLKNKI